MPDKEGRSLPAWLPGVLLTLQPVVFFWRTLVAKSTHIPWDLNGFHAPLAAEVVEALRQGRFPLWGAYIYAGYPFHADLSAQLFYPPLWPVFLKCTFGREDALLYWLEWFVAAHMVLAGAGAYLLLRRQGCRRGSALFGGTAFQLGCFFASQAQHMGAVSAAAWIPFAWLGVLRLAEGFTGRRFALLAGSLAMIFLCGYPSVALVAYGSTALLAVALSLGRPRSPRLLLWLAAGFLAAAALCAVQLFPSLELAAHSASSQRWKYVEPEGLPAAALLGAVWPNALHIFTPFDPTKYKEQVNFTFLYFYNGQAVIWLALAGPFMRVRHTRVFLAIAALCALAMCGGRLPGYGAAFRALPRLVLGSVYVEFSLVAFSLALTLAAALVLEKLVARRWGRLPAILACMTAAELLFVGSNRPMNTREGGWKQQDSTRILMHREDLLRTLRTWVHTAEPPLRTDTTEFNPRFTTSAALLRLPSANGDNPMAPLRMLAYRGLFTKVVPWERQYPVTMPESPLLDAACVGLLIRTQGGGDDALARLGWVRVPIETAEPLFVYFNREVLPRYRLVETVHRARDDAEAQAMLRGLDPRIAAVVEGPVTLPGGAVPGAPERVKTLRYTPGSVELEIDARRAAFLVAAEGWFPGWKAAIDGRSAPLYPANLAFMGVPVPEGRHRVALRYRPDAFLIWAAVSGLAWFALAAWVWREALAAKRGAGPGCRVPCTG